MKAEIKKLWTEALRSGKYHQGKGHLAQSDQADGLAHCCLGVLCEVAIEAGIISPPKWQGINYYYGIEGDHRADFLPRVVSTWAGLGNNSPVYTDHAVLDGRTKSLVSHNDDDGFSFTEIADIIEENF